jgi:hypothetical protein
MSSAQSSAVGTVEAATADDAAQPRGSKITRRLNEARRCRNVLALGSSHTRSIGNLVLTIS